MIMRMTAYGFKGYFKDGLNIFDCVIVVVSVIEWIIAFIMSL